MKYFMLKSKIHRCTVTDKNVNYEGSITIDRNLMDASGLLPYEKVEVYDIDNANRFVTYVIEGERGGGEICLNGAAARLVEKGDLLIIAAFTTADSEEEAKAIKPKMIYPDKNNKI